MLLRMAYCNTKRLLKRSIQSFKSYFAGGYERLPKTPPCNPFSFSCTTSTHTLLHFNHSYREQLQEEINCNHHLHTKQAAATMKLEDQTRSSCSHESKLIMNHYEEVDMMKNQEINENGKDEENQSSWCLVTRKLKELEMMDENNMDLVVDIQEVLHYYSRVTCPVYRHIIDKFFVEMYSGTFNITRTC